MRNLSFNYKNFLVGLLFFNSAVCFSQREAKVFFSKNEIKEVNQLLAISNFQISKIFYWKVFGEKKVCVIKVIFDGGDANSPFSGCVIMNEGATKILSAFKAQRFYLKRILENEFPFIVAEEISSKGNGWHKVLGMSGNLIKDFLDTKNNDIHTIDAHFDRTLYNPSVMRVGVFDYNKDGYNDLIFKTTLSIFEFGGNDLEEKKKIEYIFLYNKTKKMFIPKANYSFSNYLWGVN